MIRKLLTILIFSLIFTLIPTAARADGIIIPEPPFPPRPFPMRQLDIRYHEVAVTIQDQVAITRVDQVFHNPNDYTVEGEYIFPLPVGAVVSNFKLWIDDQPVEGQVLSAEEARQVYEEIVRKLVDPALLEYVDRGAVRARIFPIEPGQERRIQLEYTQVLAAENGLVRYVYPLNTEKFSRQPLERVTIRVEVESSSPIRAVYSPSHPIGISRDGEFRANIGYEAQNVLPDTDFSLYYSIGESEAFHLLTYRNPHDPTDPDGYYLALIAPRPDVEQKIIPKDVILVLDRSGSMEGEKFRQAGDALVYILEHLNPGDKFNVLTFSTGLEQFAPRLQDLDAVPQAVDWVRSSTARGSTNINRALLDALAVTNNERPTFIIFLTDGLATEGEINSDRILSNFSSAATPNVRLFTFGVGYDVDTYLLDLLATSHKGAASYVIPGERIDEIVSGFYEKISTPVLTNLRLEFPGLAVYDSYPDPLPDLFVGSQIVAVGRYRGSGVVDVRLVGELENLEQAFIFPEQVFVEEASGDVLTALPRLWATRKIGFLLNLIRLQGPDEETIDQIVKLSIRYGIVTPYTSYLVTEPVSLGAEAQSRIASDAFRDLAAAPQAPSSGQAAVEKSQAQYALEEADVASSPQDISDLVKVAGSRTYLNVDGVWVDTAFDPGQMSARQVAFLSDDYFLLLTAYPNLGPAFALGERVIAFADGVAYEVISDGESLPPLQIDPTATPPPPDPGPTGEPPSPTVVPATPEAPADPVSSFPNCLGGLLPLLILPMGIFTLSRRNRK